MPRILRPGNISLPKNLSYPTFKLELVSSSDGQTYDVTQDTTSLQVNFRSTKSLSNFNFSLSNAAGKYKGRFKEGDVFNLYYDYTQGSLTTVRFKGRLDAPYDNFNGQSGFFKTFEGRDYPQFADDKKTFSFTETNVIETFGGSSGNSEDDDGNFSNGFLFNSGLTLKVWDTDTSSFLTYKNLTSEQKTTLKSQSVYDLDVTDNFEDQARLNMAASITTDKDLAWRIEFDSIWYLLLFPENGIKNSNEVAVIGQNILNVSRFGRDTKKEFNKVKIIGESSGDILRFRIQEDVSKQSTLWIKTFVQQVTELNTDALVLSRAISTLANKKTQPITSSVTVPGLITLKPGELIHFSMPYIFTGDLLIPSFTINFGSDGFNFVLNIKDREEDLGDILKEIINGQNSLISSGNPNDMSSGFVFNFEDTSGFSFTDTEINDGLLTLSSGKSSGIVQFPAKTTDQNINKFELKIDANDFQNCTYRISNDGGQTFEVYTFGALHNFDSTGNSIILEITLNQIDSTSPQFKQVNLRSK